MNNEIKALGCTLGIILSILVLVIMTVLFPITIYPIFGATTAIMIYALYQFIYFHMEWVNRKSKDD